MGPLTKARELDPSFEVNPKVILLVDDDEFNLSVAETLLASWAFEVLLANNGTEAVDICDRFLKENRRIDLIFMDYHMPSLNGDQTTRLLRKDKYLPVLGNTPIVGLTAHFDQETKNLCLQAGMDQVENKPFDRGMIQKILEKYGIIGSKEEDI